MSLSEILYSAQAIVSEFLDDTSSWEPLGLSSFRFVQDDTTIHAEIIRECDSVLVESHSILPIETPLHRPPPSPPPPHAEDESDEEENLKTWIYRTPVGYSVVAPSEKETLKETPLETEEEGEEEEERPPKDDERGGVRDASSSSTQGQGDLLFDFETEQTGGKLLCLQFPTPKSASEFLLAWENARKKSFEIFQSAAMKAAQTIMSEGFAVDRVEGGGGDGGMDVGGALGAVARAMLGWGGGEETQGTPTEEGD